MDDNSRTNPDSEQSGVKSLLRISILTVVGSIVIGAPIFLLLAGMSWASKQLEPEPAPVVVVTPEPTGIPVVYSRILNGEASAEKYFLKGSYTTEITVIDRDENCVLSLFARRSADDFGTPIFNDLVFGNVGAYPGPYKQTFTWDPVFFSGETLRIYNEGGCNEVQLHLSRQ